LLGHVNGILRLMDVSSGRETRRFGKLDKGAVRVSSEPVQAVAIAPKGHRVASVSEQRVEVWDSQNGKKLREFDLQARPAPEAHNLVFSPSGAWLLATDGATIRLWDLTGGKERRSFVGHQGPVHGVAFTPDGRHVLSTGSDHTVRVWDAESGAELSRFEGHLREVWSVACSPDGLQALSGGGPRESMLRLWSLREKTR
jgi:WD40 repeat protein